MKTKIVEVRGSNYQLRKMLPDVGSYIYMRMMGALLEFKRSGNVEDVKQEPEQAMNEEQKARLMCGLAAMKLSFEDTQFIQRQAMLTVSKAVVSNAGESFIPVMQDSGRWVDDELLSNPALVQELVQESLVFSLSGFFAESGNSKATTNPATTNL